MSVLKTASKSSLARRSRLGRRLRRWFRIFQSINRKIRVHLKNAVIVSGKINRLDVGETRAVFNLLQELDQLEIITADCHFERQREHPAFFRLYFRRRFQAVKAEPVHGRKPGIFGNKLRYGHGIRQLLFRLFELQRLKLQKRRIVLVLPCKGLDSGKLRIGLLQLRLGLRRFRTERQTNSRTINEENTSANKKSSIYLVFTEISERSSFIF